MINTRLRDVGKCMNCRRGQRLSTCRRRKIYAPPRRAAAKSRFLLSRRRRHLAAGVLLHVILSSSPCVNAEQTARFRKWWMVRTQWSWVNSWKIANQIVSNRVFFVGQKPAYCNDFGWKKIDLLGITPNPPPSNEYGLNSVHVHKSGGDNVQESLDAIGQVRAKSNMAPRTSSAEPSFFGPQFETNFRQLSNGRTFVESMLLEKYQIQKRFSKIFRLWVICHPNPKNFRGSNRHLPHTSLQLSGRIALRYCSLDVVVQWPGSFPGHCQLFRTMYTVSELHGVKFPQFSHFCLFSHKQYLRVTSLLSGFTLQNASSYSTL